MPVKIELLTNYQLSTQSGDPTALELPVIELAPDGGNNTPHISSVSISVQGEPAEIANMIQLAYQAYREVPGKKPFRLRTPQRVTLEECRLPGPSIPEVNCLLEVKVEYFDSDAEGQPNRSEVKSATASCKIVSRAVPKPHPDPVTEHQNPVPPEPQRTSLQSGETNQMKKFAGWLAIDFGTSNSTVTLYDAKKERQLDGWPREQEEKLRAGLAQWLNDRPLDPRPGVSDNDWDGEWEKLISEVSEGFSDLDNDSQENIGDRIFTKTKSSRLLEAIGLVEIGLINRREWFRRSASKRLNQIYHEVFRVPSLEWQRLIPVELDELRKLSEIPSELEIESMELASDDGGLKVLMGGRAKQNRLEAYAQGQDLQGKFHHSPKRYFASNLENQEIQVTLNGSSQSVAVEKLIQAAFGHLLQLTKDYRDRNAEQFSRGEFNNAVVTYPTISPPKVRDKIKKLVGGLGIANVQMAYDEAVSIAIFFLWRELGGDLKIGLESFKTRCRQDLDQWSQNVLVLDIGGGTTDLALIRLTLKEEDPFKPGEDRGDGGRYYTLTPKLLGSSGHLQLGGELITLEIFKLLKVAIADCLLTAMATGNLEPELLKVQPDELNDRFLENGKFVSGKLLDNVDKEKAERDSAYDDALKAAEKLLPTSWKNGPASRQASRQQTFYSLWEHAERAKLLLGQGSQTKEGTEPTFIMDGQQIAELLAQNDIQLPQSSLNNLSVTLTVQQFANAVTGVIKEAIGIAKGLMESGLRRQEGSQENSSKEQLDWLILSGKTCNLDLVGKELKQQFSKSDRFVWNPERITFVPEYTKLATSAGACYAETLMQLVVLPQDAKELLQKGENQLKIDVKNLFYFLPCSFVLMSVDRGLTIFNAGQQLYQINQNEDGAKARSDRWYGAPSSIFVRRKDFEGKDTQLWGNFEVQDLARELNMEITEFQEKIRVQFEIGQDLKIDLLFCQEGKPYYLIKPSMDETAPIHTQAKISDGQVTCDIAVTEDHRVVFGADKDYSKSVEVFRYEGENGEGQGFGLISKPLPPFPVSGKHTFYFQKPNSNTWEKIGALPQPGGKKEYPCEYRVTLDDKGILRIHAGEIPYWTSENKECLKKKGCVYRTALGEAQDKVDEKRNPFSGSH